METILVVDDEEYIRELVGAILAIEGYNVVEADGGAQALRIAEEFPGRIHLMLSDVVMSPMGGSELAKKISPIRPDMKIIFISGYPEDDSVRFEAVRTGMFLAKPFTPKALVQKIRTILDAVPAQLQT